MAGRFSRLTLRVDELAGYRAAVIACVRPDERALSERLMGQLSSLEAGAIGAAPDAELAFRPAADAGELAVRSLEHLRTRPLRRRSRAPTS